jgi:hypothetical protein
MTVSADQHETLAECNLKSIVFSTSEYVTQKAHLQPNILNLQVIQKQHTIDQIPIKHKLPSCSQATTIAIDALLLIPLHLLPLLAAGIDCPVSGFQFSPSLAIHVFSSSVASPVNARDIVRCWHPAGDCHFV